MIVIGLGPKVSNLIVDRLPHPIPGLEVLSWLGGLVHLENVLDVRMFPNASCEQRKNHRMVVRSNVWTHLLEHHVKLVNETLKIHPLHLEVIEMTNAKI